MLAPRKDWRTQWFKFERSALGDFIWVYEKWSDGGNIESHGNLFLAYLGERVKPPKRLLSVFIRTGKSSDAFGARF
ncbi:hypothetical protein [Enterobacter cloacae]|uniref:hypothetical protein n=1 Tax=Enterobacter cloacae TaxID=550 RepID=UPI003890D45C